jgi:hypothetical protein
MHNSASQRKRTAASADHLCDKRVRSGSCQLGKIVAPRLVGEGGSVESPGDASQHKRTAASADHLLRHEGPRGSCQLGKDVAPRLVGEGGCVAAALCAFGLFVSKEDATRALDEEIDCVLAKLSKQKPDLKRKDVGIDGSIWCTKVIQQTVLKAGFNFRKLKERKDWLSAIGQGKSVLIDGYLNTHFYTRRGGGLRKHCMYPGLTADTHSGDWRHVTAVVQGRIYDEHLKHYRNGSISANCLWLDEEGRVESRKIKGGKMEKKGFMHTVERAYMISSSTQ